MGVRLAPLALSNWIRRWFVAGPRRWLAALGGRPGRRRVWVVTVVQPSSVGALVGIAGAL